MQLILRDCLADAAFPLSIFSLICNHLELSGFKIVKDVLLLGEVSTVLLGVTCKDRVDPPILIC